MVTKKIEQGWVKAEMQINLGNPDEALEILREIDADAKEPKTWRLAAAVSYTHLTLPTILLV